jgi:hypothetical protein
LLDHVKGLSRRKKVTVTSLVEEGLRWVLARDEAERVARHLVEAPVLIDAEQV